MQELNCEVKIIPTYYIEEHSGATDHAFLQCMVNQHAKQGFDFAIIATGSNDITMMDTENAPATTIFQQAKEQSELLCDIAKNMSTELNLDLFIMEKPPRYDQPAKDPSGMKQKLSRYSNGVLATTTGLVPRTFLVEQAGLSRSSDRARKELFQPDGIHLTPKGLSFYTSNLISTIQECYEDTKQLRVNTGVDRDSGTGQGPIRDDQGRGRHSQGGRGRDDQGGRGRDDQHHGRDYRPPQQRGPVYYWPPPGMYNGGRGKQNYKLHS